MAPKPDRAAGIRTLGWALVQLAAVIAVLRGLLGVTNPTAAALVLLFVVGWHALTATLAPATGVALAAALGLNYFFLPPIGTLLIADPQHWLALVAFLAVGVSTSAWASAARDRQAAEVARQRQALATTVVASLAHSLRTPLTALRIAAREVSRPDTADADRRSQAEVLVAETARLSGLVDEILDMARIDAGTLTPAASWTTTQEIYQAARASTGAALAARRVDVSFGPPDLIRVDARLLSAALARFLENGAQYATAASRLQVAFAVEGDHLTIAVDDEGPGLSEDEWPRVFEPFARGAAAAGRPGGTGLGLAIAKGFVEAAGGHVAAGPSPLGGARFAIRLVLGGRRALPVDPEPT